SSSPYAPPLLLHPFPTRRSSDLVRGPLLPAAERQLPERRRADLRRHLLRLGSAGQQRRRTARVLVLPDADRARHQRRRRWHGLRSEEHTSELQSLAYLVCRLLLE